MKAPTSISLAAFLILSAAIGEAKTPASEAVVLATKGFLQPVGSVITKEMSMTMDGATLNIEAGGQKMDGKATQTAKGKETIEVLSKDKVRRTVVSKTTGGKMTMNGQDQPTPPQPDALEGKPVILERSADGWKAKLEDNSEANEDQQAGLDKMAKEMTKDSDFEMYGDTPRKPGDKWTVDPAKLSNFGDSEDTKGTCTVEFVEIADFQGTRCAVLKSTLEIKGKTASKGEGPSMNMDFKAEAVSHRSIADQLDLAVDIKGTMSIDGAPAPEVTMHMEGPTVITEKNSLKKP